MKPLLTLLALTIATSIFSQSPDLLSIRKYREENTAAIMREYVAFLSIPNTANTPPVVYGEVNTPGTTQTLIF